jgi:hypothetical protein
VACAGRRRIGDIPAPQVTINVPPQARANVRGGIADDTAASGARLSVAGDVVSVSVSPSWLAGLPASAFPVVIDPSFGGQEGPSEFVSLDNQGHSTYTAMQVGVDNLGKTWRTAAYFPVPTPPAPLPGGQAWELSLAGFTAGCGPSACVQLSNVSLYGLATPAPPSVPTYAGIPFQTSQLLWASPPGQLQAVVQDSGNGQSLVTLLNFMRPNANGWWFGITGNENGGPLVQFAPTDTTSGNGVFVTYYYVQQPPAPSLTQPASGVVSTTTPTLAATVTDTVDNPATTTTGSRQRRAAKERLSIRAGWPTRPAGPFRPAACRTA